MTSRFFRAAAAQDVPEGKEGDFSGCAFFVVLSPGL